MLDLAALYLQNERGAGRGDGGAGLRPVLGDDGADALRRRRRPPALRRRRHNARLRPHHHHGPARGRPFALAVAGHRRLRLRRARHRQRGPDRLLGGRQPSRPVVGNGHEHRHHDGLFGHTGRSLGDRLRRADGGPRSPSSSPCRRCSSSSSSARGWSRNADFRTDHEPEA